MDTDAVIAALRSRTWRTADLVRISHAVAGLGLNTTSVLGQYGEELVARAFGGTVASFDQKAFDVRMSEHGDLQVKTYSVSKRPGVIRSFTHDVVTVEVDPSTAAVRRARRYAAADLLVAFSALYIGKYVGMGMVWGGSPGDRFERGWSISPRVPSEDITDRLQAVVET